MNSVSCLSGLGSKLLRLVYLLWVNIENMIQHVAVKWDIHCDEDVK